MRPPLPKKIFKWTQMSPIEHGYWSKPLFVLLMTLTLNNADPILAASKDLTPDLPRVGDRSKPSSKDKPSTATNNQSSSSSRDLQSGELESSVTSDVDLQGWSSSVDSSTESTAKEITKGVRVEDIVEPPSDYHYASFGKPDPFVPPLLPPAPVPEKGAGPSSLEVPIVSALQRYAIDDLRIVGIWQHSNGDRKALVLTPSGSEQGGQGVIVRAGDPIGNRGGKILAIANDFIAVREFFLAPDGIRQYEDRRMLMTITPPEKQPAHLLFKPGERLPKEVSDEKEVNLDDAGLMRQKSDTNQAPGMTTNSQTLRGTRTPTFIPQRNASTEFNQGGLSRDSGVEGPSNSGQFPGTDPTRAPSQGQNMQQPASISTPVTSPNAAKSAPSDTSNLGAVAPSDPNLTNAPPNGAQLGIPPLNGMPPNYINGVVGGVGRDISQPASNSIPTQ
jgi:Tfp pilus assembly protein PilP